MAALNFPTTGLVAGVTEYSANGTTYLWDGIKWVGRTAGGAAGTNSIQNNGNTVQVGTGGELVLPAYTLPNTEGTIAQVLTWPQSGTVLEWTDQVGGGSGNIVSTAGPAITFSKLFETNVGGIHYQGENIAFVSNVLVLDAGLTQFGPGYVPSLAWNMSTLLETWNANGAVVGEQSIFNAPHSDSANIGVISFAGNTGHGSVFWSGDQELEDIAGQYMTSSGNVVVRADAQNWVFTPDGILSMPTTTTLNSGGIGVPNSAEIGTSVAFDGPDIVNSEIFMGSGYGEFRSIYNKTSPLESGLVYAGVEGFNYVQQGDVNFAGMVSQTPNIDSMYALRLNEQGQIVIGFTQNGQTQTSNDWSVAVGTLTTDYTFNGLFANTARTVISSSGTNGIELNTNRGTVLFGNQPEAPLPTDSHHWHIMPADPSATDLFFGNDTNYVKLPRGTGDVVIGAEGPEWKFDNAGVLNLPNNNGQIGQLEAPYTGLEFRTGSGADWIGISYGEINDNNTSYFYFDKDGSNYLTANHRAHLQLKNAAHDGHVEWLFDVTGNLTLPPGGDILNSSGQSVLGAGGNGTANRVQFANAGSIYQADDAEAGRYNIIVNAEKDVIINTDAEGQEFRFTSTGNLKLPRNSTISDQDESLDITINRTSDNPFWYNLFGDTGATIDANTTVNGSVCHDTGGNVYSLGSVTHSVGFNTDNLFLKYSPEGNLLWRRTWTDNAGMDCGSLNASLRFIAANVELGTQDTIAWAAWVPGENLSYVGTMDTEGNMVDQFGDSRLATRLDSVRVTDLEWVGNAYGDGNSIVGVVGNYYLYDGSDHYQPFICAVDLDLGAIIYNSTLVPAGSDSTKGGWNPRSFDNIFKAITVLPGNVVSAFVGTYYDGADSHAMIAVSGYGTTLFQIGQGTDDNIGEDICCDANGNVYVIVNNITNDYAVLSKVNVGALLATQDSVWQKQLGFDPITVNDRFYATAVAYDNGYVYVLGTYYNVEDNDTDTMLIKVNALIGSIVWQRRIGTAVREGPGGAGVFGAPGWESSSGISIYDNLIAVTFSTEFNSANELNTVTLQYPVDGSILGTFGDFTITDFSIGATSANYGITTLTASVASAMATAGLATLDPTVLTVGTGWTNTQWDLENNRQVYGTKTFKFNVDGTFDTAEITHEGEVRITARVAPEVIEPTPATWAFQNNEGLRFPDGSVQYGAYVEQETALDGGSAVSVYNIVPRPLVADGGGSSSRHGVTDPVYDGSSGNDYVLDGGGA